MEPGSREHRQSVLAVPDGWRLGEMRDRKKTTITRPLGEIWGGPTYLGIWGVGSSHVSPAFWILLGGII